MTVLQARTRASTQLPNVYADKWRRGARAVIRARKMRPCFIMPRILSRHMAATLSFSLTFREGERGRERGREGGRERRHDGPLGRDPLALLATIVQQFLLFSR